MIMEGRSALPDNPSDPDGVHIDQADATGSGLPEGSIPVECAGDGVER
jgi:hypothetical protein